MSKTLEPVWPNNKQIEVIGVTGEYSSGKTLFGLTIDPKNTLYYDYEKSGGTYDGLGVTRVDVPDELHRKHPKGFKPIDAFSWWYQHIKTIEANQYSVIMCDPISDIEEGAVEWVKGRYKEFGFQSAENFQKTGGIFWAKVKAEWKRILADIAARCQTFVFSTHLKDVWVGNKSTGKRVPKGKSTLMELASLYLFMEREADKNGKVPLIPAATVLKTRLADTTMSEGGVVITPTLPPRLPQATPDAIRKYIITPPNYDKLKTGEKVLAKTMTDDAKLLLQAEIAQDTRAAQEAALETQKSKETLEAAKAAARARIVPNADKAQETRKDQKAASKPKKEEPAAETTTEERTFEISQEEADTMLNTAEQLGITERIKKGIVKKLESRGEKVDVSLATPRLLTRSEFAEFTAGLAKVAADKNGS